MSRPDPSVSPADTIRRDPAAKLRELVEHHKERVAKGRPPYAALWITPEDAESLLAVGERDRRQIAQLTEALERLLDCRGAANGTVSKRGGEPAVCRECADAARAVLAGEEDAK